MAGSRGSWTAAIVDGPLILSVGKSRAGMTAVVGGALTFDGSLVGPDHAPAIWPERTAWDADRRELRLPSGETVRLGQRVWGGGGYLAASAVRDLFGDAAAEACGSADQVRVFNPGQDIALLTQ